MDTSHPRLRPARRSLLLSGALLLPLGLAGCDPEEERKGPEEEEIVPTLTLVPMATDEELRPEEPVLEDTWNVSPTEDRSLAVLVSRMRAQRRDLFAITLSHPGGVEVPIDPATTALAVDGHGATVGVLAASVVGTEHRQQLWRSSDLVDWESVEVTGIDREIGAYGGGVVASVVVGSSVAHWELAENGTATALTTLEAPADAWWTVLDVARYGATIVLLMTATDAEGNAVPTTVTSQDSGGTWGEPVALPDVGEDAAALSICPLGEGFLVIGNHEPPSDGGAYHRPTAWTSGDGKAFTQEEIPLPTFGLEGWTRGSETISPDEPLDRQRVDATPAVIDARTGTAHVAILIEDDCRCASRSASGEWTVSALGKLTGNALDHGAATPDTQIMLGEKRAYVREVGAGALVGGLPFTTGRLYLRMRHDVSSGIDAVIQSNQRRIDTSTSRISISYSENTGVSIDGEGLVLAADFPSEAEGWAWGRIHRGPDGQEILSGREEDDEGNGTLLSLVRREGEWVGTEGFEIPGVYQLGSASTVEGTIYFPGAGTIADEDGTSLGGIAVLSSADGVTWEQAGEGPVSPAEDPAFAEGGYISSVASVDGVLIGLGTAVDEDFSSRAATFLLTDGVWVPHMLESVPRGVFLGHPFQVGDTVQVFATSEGRTYLGVLGADGSCTQLWQSSDEERRGAAHDLGGGVQIAAGWSRTGAVYGACVWASRDGGETWTATLLPGHEGRFPTLYVALDGDDVVVIAAHDDAPAGFRIVGAREAMMPAEQ